MSLQKKLLREIYDAPPNKKKDRKPKHDVGGPSSLSLTLSDLDQETLKPSEQGTNNASLPAVETGEGEQGQLKKASALEGYTKEVTTGEMSEPRARAARQKGQLNFGTECKFYCVTLMIIPVTASSTSVLLGALIAFISP